MKTVTVYLAGPLRKTGSEEISAENVAYFATVEAAGRGIVQAYGGACQAYRRVIINPARNGPEPDVVWAARNARSVMRADEIWLLPGWQNSRRTWGEIFTALAASKPKAFRYVEATAFSLSLQFVDPLRWFSGGITPWTKGTEPAESGSPRCDTSSSNSAKAASGSSRTRRGTSKTCSRKR